MARGRNIWESLEWTRAVPCGEKRTGRERGKRVTRWGAASRSPKDTNKLLTKTVGLYREEQARALSWRSWRWGAMSAKRTLSQVGTEGCRENLVAGIHFNILNRLLSHLPQVWNLTTFMPWSGFTQKVKLTLPRVLVFVLCDWLSSRLDVFPLAPLLTWYDYAFYHLLSRLMAPSFCWE